MAEIDLGRLRHNARLLMQRAGAADLMAVVKANAFGHGAVPVTRALQEAGVEHFAVARLPEALELREAGVRDAILLFEAPLPHTLATYAAHDLGVTVPSAAVAEAVVAAARQHGPLRAHLKVETGMGRLGVPVDAAPALARRLREAPGVTLAGVWTHLATADDPAQHGFAHAQLLRFRRAHAAVGVPPGCVHAANSAALLALPERLRGFDPAFVRTGIALYGLATTARLAARAGGLRPVMRLVSRVTHTATVAAGTPVSYGRTWTARRTTRIATVGAGYGDGYHRLCSNRAEVGIGGRRYPVVGTVCMDLLMVDLGPPGGPGCAVAVGDEVVLFGAGGPSAYEVAAWAKTIPYEVCCSVAARVPRWYREQSSTTVLRQT